jgi:hypothetical protein
VGGAFQQDILNPTVPTCGGQVRNHIAALNASTGLAITSWNPNANLDVRVLALSPNSNKLYVGGNFTTISGQSRNKIAEIDLSAGTATTWNPNIDLQVLALKVSGSIVYVGGGFTCIGPATDPNLCGQTGGTPRNRIAALQVSDGKATPWNPNSNSSVEAIEVSGNIVYVGGTFTPTPVIPNSIGGAPRNNIAALDASTGLATSGLPASWDPNVNGAVHTLALAGSTVYAGGEFDSVGGETPRNNIAAFDETTGKVCDGTLPGPTPPCGNVDPNANGAVHALAVFGNTVYIGGDFTTLNGGALLRKKIAALEATSGAPSTWNPNADPNDEGKSVRALAVSPDGATVYAGGDFTSIGGMVRNGIAALVSSGTAAGSATDWNPGANGSVFALATTSNKVYVGGSFSTIGGGTPRANLAFLKGTCNPNTSGDCTTGTVQSSWDPSPNGPVYTILLGGITPCTAGTGTTPTVYIGGDFTSLNGGATQRSHIAALKTGGSGNVCDWRPDANGAVRALARSGDTLFMGGDFTSAGGVSSLNRLTAVDVVSGSANSWNPRAADSVRALAVSNTTGTLGTLYAGGSFLTIAGSTNPSVGLPRNNLAVFSFATLGGLVAPSSRSVLVGDQAAAFMVVVNGSPTPATNVSIAPKSSIAGNPPFHFWSFDPINGFGPQDTAVNIPPFPGSQVFVISFTPGVAITPPTEVRFDVEGTNTTTVGSISGWNTMYLSASTASTADIFTSSSAAVVSFPQTKGQCIGLTSFGIAALNPGVGQAITVVSKGSGSVATTGSSPSVKASICRINSSNKCAAPPASSITLPTFAGGTGEVFAVFVEGVAGETIPCDFDNNRLFIEFREGSSTGLLRGLASVAACTIGVCGQ